MTERSIREKRGSAWCRSRSRAGLIFAITLAATAGAAQNAGRPASELYFNLSTGLLATDNYYALINPVGTSTIWTNDLDLGYQTSTSNSFLSFTTGAEFNFGHFAERPNINSDFRNPYGRFDYQWFNRDSRLSFGLGARQSDNRFRINENDELRSEDLINDAGTRTDLNVDLGGDFGRTGPTSLEFDFTYRQREYQDTINPNLSDETITLFNVEAGFRITPTTRLLLTGDLYDRDSLDNTRSDDTNVGVGVGFSSEIDKVRSFRGTLRFSRNETTYRTAGGDVTDVQESPLLQLGYQQARPNGNISLNFDSRLRSTGVLATLSFGRSFDTKVGSLSFNIGGTRTEEGNATPVGSINWVRAGKASQISLGANSSVNVNNNNDEVVNGSLRFRYRQDVNKLSGFNVGLNLAASEGFEVEGVDRRQASLTLGYYFSLTKEWQLQTTYRHNYNVNSIDNVRTENRISATIDRRFSIRP